MWSEKDLQGIKKKGFAVVDNHIPSEVIKLNNKNKISVEKKTIELFLNELCYEKAISSFLAEYQFDLVRKFRFDWFIPELNLGIEYEGLISEKSGHLTIGGYSKDCEKYNLAAINGFAVMRYTVVNYQNCKAQVLEFILARK